MISATRSRTVSVNGLAFVSIILSLTDYHFPIEQEKVRGPLQKLDFLTSFRSRACVALQSAVVSSIEVALGPVLHRYILYFAHFPLLSSLLIPYISLCTAVLSLAATRRQVAYYNRCVPQKSALCSHLHYNLSVNPPSLIHETVLIVHTALPLFIGSCVQELTLTAYI